jgi:hypothetical protein
VFPPNSNSDMVGFNNELANARSMSSVFSLSTDPVGRKAILR